MIELIAVLLILVISYGAWVWRGEANYQKIRANSAEAKLAILQLHYDDVAAENHYRGRAIKKLMAHDFQFSVDFADLNIPPIEVCTKCFRVKQEEE